MPGDDAGFRRLTAVPLLFHPGEGFRSSVGVAVAAHIACQLSGQSLQELVSSRVLQPLGMESTRWWNHQHPAPPRAPPPHVAAPWLLGTWGLGGALGCDNLSGHTSRLGWKATAAAPSASVLGSCAEGLPACARVGSFAARSSATMFDAS